MLSPVHELIEDLKEGKFIVLVDDEGRENEGDLVMASEFITPEAVNFMASEGRGLICLSLEESQVDRLGLSLMVPRDKNDSPHSTAFTVSIEAAEGVSTGISASDRAHTIKVASNPLAEKKDIVTPGHVFPIQAESGGVLKRAGHTEASVDLVRLAGLPPSAVICEIMNLDGSMSRLGDLKQFSKRHKIKIGSIADLIAYRLEKESFISEVKTFPMRTPWGGEFLVRVYKNKLDGMEHIAVCKGALEAGKPALIRIHKEDTFQDSFGLKGPNFFSLEESLKEIEKAQAGAFIYLRSAQGSLFKKAAPDNRNYGIGAQIIKALGVKKVILLSTKPQKKVGLESFGFSLVGYQTPEGFLPKA